MDAKTRKHDSGGAREGGVCMLGQGLARDRVKLGEQSRKDGGIKSFSEALAAISASHAQLPVPFFCLFLHRKAGGRATASR